MSASSVDDILAGRADLVALAADTYEQDLVHVLNRLSSAVVELSAKLDSSGGHLSASKANVEFAAGMYDTLLEELEAAGYHDAAEKYVANYGDVWTKVVDTYKVQGIDPGFRTIDRTAVEQARDLDLASFTDIGSNAMREIQRSIRQNVLYERDFTTFVQSLKATITGTDKKGSPLHVHAATFADTAISQFDAQVTGRIGDEAGIEYYRYTGPLDKITRPWCRARLKNNIPRTKEEIDALAPSSSNSTGQSNFIGRGGWRCRHLWRPVPIDEIAATKTAAKAPAASTAPVAAPAIATSTAPPASLVPPPPPVAVIAAAPAVDAPDVAPAPVEEPIPEVPFGPPKPTAGQKAAMTKAANKLKAAKAAFEAAQEPFGPFEPYGPFLTPGRKAALTRARNKLLAEGATVPQPVEPDSGGSTDPWPEDLGQLTIVRRLGGASGAQLAVDPLTGAQYVMKRGMSQPHLLEESLADTLYGALGAKVPPHRLYSTPKGHVKLSRFIENAKTIGELRTTDPAAYEKATRQLHEHYAVDALMANWDVIGPKEDNVMIDADGDVWRIDNGGALRFGGLGGPKESFRKQPERIDELWTLKGGPMAAPGRARAFREVDFVDVVGQLERIDSSRQGVLDSVESFAAMPAADRSALKTMLEARLETVTRLKTAGRDLVDAKFKGSYIDPWAQHYHDIGFDVAPHLPAKLLKSGTTNLVDEKGNAYDALRGPHGMQKVWRDYQVSKGIDPAIVADRHEAQAGNSWRGHCKAYKYWLASHRDVPDDRYYWGPAGVDDCRKRRDAAVAKLTIERFEAANIAQHALTYTIFERVRMPKSDETRRLVRLRRTETKAVMTDYGIGHGKGLQMPRGAAESGSLLAWTNIHGHERTMQDVPWARLLGFWGWGRGPESFKGSFLNDTENEVLFLPEGIEFDYGSDPT